MKIVGKIKRSIDAWINQWRDIFRQIDLCTDK